MVLRFSGLLRPTRRHASSVGVTFRPCRLQHTLSANYDSTVPNLKIGSHTRVIFQGFTGRQATQNAQQSIEYGTKIVGGVTPGKHGEHLGLPVFPTVRAAKENLKPDATAVYVPAPQAAAAIEEAIEAEIPLIVAVAEHIPLHHLLRVHAMLQSQSKSRLVGANSPGMISATGRCRIGFHPLPTFEAGAAGIVAKSGTLSYESIASTTRAGVGQSLVIGMGGDPLPGTDFVDALKIFEHDETTQGIIMIGEIGGAAEEEAAEWIKQYHTRNTDPKPILALIAGIEAPRNRTMGHAGAYITYGGSDAKAKIHALKEAGAILVSHPAQCGDVLKPLLEQRVARASLRTAHDRGVLSSTLHQRRDIHTCNRRPSVASRPAIHLNQRRNLLLTDFRSSIVLRDHNIPVVEAKQNFLRKDQLCLAVMIDRTQNSPCIMIAPFADGCPVWNDGHRLSFKYGEFLKEKVLEDWVITATITNRAINQVGNKSNLASILTNLIETFYQENAAFLLVRVAKSSDGEYVVVNHRCELDDAALRLNKTAEELQVLREEQKLHPEEVEAAKDGIVYWRLPGKGSIGTLVNGAGLAMNTNDTIRSLGGLCTNFLDTGGKATKETIKSSFRIILKDPRVKVIFVNIYGGLTLCDMIAEGIMLAYNDLGIRVPVVTRLRGTNEGLGQTMIASSGLPLLAFDDFTEAAKKAIEIAEQNTQEPEEAVFGSDIWQESNDTQNINRRMKLSSPLSALLDGHTELSGPKVRRKIWEYARRHRLLDADKEWPIRCDDAMRAVFEKDEINRQEMRSFLKKHLSETDKDRNIVRPVYT